MRLVTGLFGYMRSRFDVYPKATRRGMSPVSFSKRLGHARVRGDGTAKSSWHCQLNLLLGRRGQGKEREKGKYIDLVRIVRHFFPSVFPFVSQFRSMNL